LIIVIFCFPWFLLLLLVNATLQMCKPQSKLAFFPWTLVLHFIEGISISKRFLIYLFIIKKKWNRRYCFKNITWTFIYKKGFLLWQIKMPFFCVKDQLAMKKLVFHLFKYWHFYSSLKKRRIKTFNIFIPKYLLLAHQKNYSFFKKWAFPEHYLYLM